MPGKKAEVIEATERTRKRRRRAPLTGVSRLRKAANARERERVRVLNEGIERLRVLLPKDEQNVKPTKTEIIWMAARYISELKDVLHECDSDQSSGSEEVEDFLGTFQHGIVLDTTNLDSLMKIDMDELVSFGQEHQILFREDYYEL